MTYVLTYDIGTTAVKTCLFGIEKNITLIGERGKFQKNPAGVAIKD